MHHPSMDGPGAAFPSGGSGAERSPSMRLVSILVSMRPALHARGPVDPLHPPAVKPRRQQPDPPRVHLPAPLLVEVTEDQHVVPLRQAPRGVTADGRLRDADAVLEVRLRQLAFGGVYKTAGEAGGQPAHGEAHGRGLGGPAPEAVLDVPLVEPVAVHGEAAQAAHLEGGLGAHAVEGGGVGAAGEEEVAVALDVVDGDAGAAQLADQLEERVEPRRRELREPHPRLEQVAEEHHPGGSCGRQLAQLREQRRGRAARAVQVGVGEEGDPPVAPHTMLQARPWARHHTILIVRLPWRSAALTTASAIRRKAAACAPSGCATTMGTPASPPSAIAASSGIRPRNSVPSSAAVRSPPPCLKIAVSCPQAGHTKVDMFSTTPSTGTLSLRNMARPLRASMSATSCGVVTTTAPAIGIFCAMVSCASPVPGGKSATR